jgi:hypothetical protein
LCVTVAGRPSVDCFTMRGWTWTERTMSMTSTWTHGCLTAEWREIGEEFARFWKRIGSVEGWKQIERTDRLANFSVRSVRKRGGLWVFSSTKRSGL